MTQDPFAPARRALLVGPVLLALGGGLVYLGVAGSGPAWLLCVLGGLLALAGLLRIATGAAVLLIERRRLRILRTGTPATAQITGLRELGEKAGHPIYEWDLSLKRPDGTVKTATRRGAVPPQYGGSFDAGDELPIRLDDDGETFAVDWDAL
jgi:hypothetical protein